MAAGVADFLCTLEKVAGLADDPPKFQPRQRGSRNIRKSVLAAMNPERRLRKLMVQTKSERELPLRELAQELGCSLTGTYSPKGVHLEDIVIERIRDAARAQRKIRTPVLLFAFFVAAVLAIFVGLLTLFL